MASTPEILKESGVKLGNSYPMPIVDLKTSRQMALEAFSKLPKSA